MNTFITTLIQRTITFSILIVSFLGIFFLLPPFILSILFAICFLYSVIIEWKQFFDPHLWSFWFLLPLYPFISFLLLILLNQDNIHRILLLIMFALVAGFDTGAYITGSLFGKYKLIPRISPGKTWEGLIGGYLVSLIIGYSIAWYIKGSVSFFDTLIIITITNILALGGDLFESYLKRRAGIKDSGSLLPGHGGLLDRFDSILWAIFFFYIWRDYLLTALVG